MERKSKNPHLYISFILYSFILFNFTTISQPVNVAWVQRYNNQFNSQDAVSDMVLDSQGNIYITGNFIHQTESNNIITIKYNSSGIQQWASVYATPPGTNGIDVANAIILDDSNNVYVTGTSNWGTNYWDFELVLIKYNKYGMEQWVRKYRSPDNLQSGGNKLSYKNGFIYVGGSYKRSITKQDFLLMKYNRNGDTLWTRTYNGPYGGIMYGHSEDAIRSMSIDNNGNVYVTGESGVEGTPQYIDWATIKYNQNGDSVWGQRYSTPGADYPRKILVDYNYNVYVAGYTYYYNDKYTVVKYNSSGLQQWVSVYDEYDDDQIISAALDSYGNIYVTGFSWSQTSGEDIVTIKYNTNGIQQWLQRYNGPGNSYDEGNDIAVDNSNNVYVTGFRRNTSQLDEFTTIKYDQNGLQKWMMTRPGGGSKVKLDNNGCVIVTGISDSAGTGKDIVTIKYDQLTGIASSSGKIPTEYILYQNYPNPFNPVTKIRFDISASTPLLNTGGNQIVKLVIYNSLGKEVEKLINEELYPGEYEFEWNGSNYVSGIYFYRLSVGNNNNYNITKKMLMVK